MSDKCLHVRFLNAGDASRYAEWMHPFTPVQAGATVMFYVSDTIIEQFIAMVERDLVAMNLTWRDMDW